MLKGVVVVQRIMDLLKQRLFCAGAIFLSHIYHWYASALAPVVGRMLGEVPVADGPPDFGLRRLLVFIYRTFPPTTGVLRLGLLVVVVWSFFIVLPMNPGEPDSTFWVGILSFGSALGLGLAASLSLFSKLLHRFALEYVVRSVEHGLRKWTPDVSDNRTFREFAFEEFKDPSDLELHAAPRFLRPVFLQIFIAIVLFPLYPVLSGHWAYALVIYFSACTLDMLLEYWIYIMQLSSDLVWDIFVFLKKGHDEMLQFCPVCSVKLIVNPDEYTDYH